jgi:oxygen-dependent protoporphyrinogen oxidase
MSESKPSSRTLDRDVAGGIAASVASRRPVVAVVGGGISGLAVAHYVRRTGAECIVLEAAHRTGGVIASLHEEGRILELGPQRTRLTPPLLALVESLGLTDRLVTAPDLPLYIYSRGRLRSVPLDLCGALTTDLISWTDRLRMLCEPFTRGLDPNESAADFFIRKFGRRVYREALAPLFGDLYGSDPAEMPAGHALAALLRSLRIEGSLLRALFRAFRSGKRFCACSFDGGLQVLTDAMASRLGGRVRTLSTVQAIHRDGSRYRIVLDVDEISADRVVLACPAGPAARMLATLDSGTSERLGTLRYNRFAVVHLIAENPFHGSGYQVTLGSGFATCGVTCNAALFDRAGLYTAFLGGAGRRNVPELPDADLGALASTEFGEITGGASRPLAVHRTYMPAWDTSWNGLADVHLPQGMNICANWLGRPGITARLAEAEKMAEQVAAA